MRNVGASKREVLSNICGMMKQHRPVYASKILGFPTQKKKLIKSAHSGTTGFSLRFYF